MLSSSPSLTLFLLATVLLVWGTSPASAEEKPLRVGLIGLDTSHVIQFTKALNAAEPKAEFENVRVVAAYAGGSPDVFDSASRVEGFTKQISQMGVEIVDSIDELLTKVDAVMLTSVDGRPHLQQVEPVFKAGKPVFIDKPIAGSLADTAKIFAIAREYDVPCFSSSSLRFSPELVAASEATSEGEILGCVAYGPYKTEEHHPDLFWYGIHSVEMLYTVMGPGCVSVTRTVGQTGDIVTGVWNDGRVATWRGISEGKAAYGVVVFRPKAIRAIDVSVGYDPMLIEVVKFLRGGKPPVTADETLEIYTFMEAADESKRQGGVPVAMEDVRQAAGISTAKSR